MRAVVQRVRQASVSIDGKKTAEIGNGLLVLLGVGSDDTENDADYLAEKLVRLRLFPTQDSGFDASLIDHPDYSVLVVSQFTLYGDCRKGRRPSFSQAAPPEEALRLYERLVDTLKKEKVPVATGTFQAMMDVSLINWGPVTLMLDSKRSF